MLRLKEQIHQKEQRQQKDKYKMHLKGKYKMHLKGVITNALHLTVYSFTFIAMFLSYNIFTIRSK